MSRHSGVVGSLHSGARRRRAPRLLVPAACLALAAAPANAGHLDHRGQQFVAFPNMKGFDRGKGLEPEETIFVSREIRPQISVDELIASWNVDLPEDGYLKVEARVWPAAQETPTKYFVLGLWSPSPKLHPRESVLRQADDTGTVATDTLRLKDPAERVQLRLTLGGHGKPAPRIKFVGLCLTDTHTNPGPLPPNKSGWGKTLDVPERSQMAYENGGVLCSPTTVSMLLNFYGKQLKRSDLEKDVPEIVEQIYDPNWEGTGNWPFNMAYAGSFRGLRGYVSRWSDVAEIEDWIAHGLPVGLSVCYNQLRGRPGPPSGHLVVCVGFTRDGDPIINDPGTSKNVRKVFPRQDLIKAWAHSRNAVYLVYPEKSTLPPDRFGHWESRQTKFR